MVRRAGAAGPRTTTIGVRLSKSELAALDILRGPLTRVEYLRSLFTIQKRKLIQNQTPQPDILRHD